MGCGWIGDLARGQQSPCISECPRAPAGVGADVCLFAPPGECYPALLGKPARESSQGGSPPHSPKPERIKCAPACQDLGTRSRSRAKKTRSLALHILGLGPQVLGARSTRERDLRQGPTPHPGGNHSLLGRSLFRLSSPLTELPRVEVVLVHWAQCSKCPSGGEAQAPGAAYGRGGIWEGARREGWLGGVHT